MKKPKKRAAPENPRHSEETSKLLLQIEIDPDLLADLRSASKADRKAIGELIEEVRRGFGKPHLHRGVGIRDLGHGVYECRRNLNQRLIFTAHNGYLYFHRLGSHNQVKLFLKNL